MTNRKVDGRITVLVYVGSKAAEEDSFDQPAFSLKFILSRVQER